MPRPSASIWSREAPGSAFPIMPIRPTSRARLLTVSVTVDIVAGGRLYEFKTSPQNAEYFKSLITGGFAGLRRVSKYNAAASPLFGQTGAPARWPTSAAPSILLNLWGRLHSKGKGPIRRYKTWDSRASKLMVAGH